MKKINLLLLCFFIVLNIFLLYKIFLHKSGISQLSSIKTRIKDVQDQIYRLKMSNYKLIRKIRMLRQDPEFMKRIIKNKLLFVEKDEVIYTIVIQKGE